MPLARNADALTLLAEFTRTRWGYRFASRDHLLRWQARQVNHYLQRVLPQFPFYVSHLSGRGVTELEALPLLDKSQVCQHFDELNQYGIARSIRWPRAWQPSGVATLRLHCRTALAWGCPAARPASAACFSSAGRKSAAGRAPSWQNC